MEVGKIKKLTAILLPMLVQMGILATMYIIVTMLM
jgi:hypothetical protein